MKVLFVCLGNICRSPTAEALFRAHARDAGLAVTVDSAGTSGWHDGDPPDRRSRAAAARRGVDISAQRSRRLTADDFAVFDLVVAMDRENLANMQALRPPSAAARTALLLDYLADEPLHDVPDPYYQDGFDAVFDLIDRATRAMVAELSR